MLRMNRREFLLASSALALETSLAAASKADHAIHISPVPGPLLRMKEGRQPGRSLLPCQMQQHMDYGFKTMIEYTA